MISDLHFLASSGLTRLGEFRKQLENYPEHFPATARKMVLEQVKQLMEEYKQILSERVTGYELRVTKEKLRALSSVSAGLIASLDWQSPSFEHSRLSQAGRHTGAIEGTRTDYKRDQHHDAADYERTFVQAYIDTHLHLMPRAYVTSSGMAAFTTIVASLLPDIGSDDRILVGEGSYFENKRVLKQFFGERVKYVDEMDRELVMQKVKAFQPKAIFFDTLGNVEHIVMPDLATVIPSLSKIVTQPTYLVLDNSVLATSFQPLKYLPHFSKLRLIVFESLNKFHQYGWDRVTGGIIWTAAPWQDRIFGTRLHLGTNMPQASVLALPEPNRKLLDERIARIQHNTQVLGTTLDHQIRSSNTPLSHAVYPARAPYFTLVFKKEYANVPTYLKFVDAVMKEARRSSVDLNAGTSFGFESRVYILRRGMQTKMQSRLFVLRQERNLRRNWNKSKTC